MKIVEYSVENWIDVRPMLQRGYQPYGSPFMWDGQPCQAMVRYEEVDKATQAAHHIAEIEKLRGRLVDSTEDAPDILTRDDVFMLTDDKVARKYYIDTSANSVHHGRRMMLSQERFMELEENGRITLKPEEIVSNA